ncbi:hypothetical protein B0H67DRAFT_650386 [Lasiosphaeris hirsuta]|uniref:MYND-type domain-containing protein n=1 Tax=Lasiosphaeris hirsuta TaxID=260670 RepID=A0AA40DG85_9PEZI|nr:hypothetical protein B0H67DRAFT_650386 [Lasiosphaeris hirsuta]
MAAFTCKKGPPEVSLKNCAKCSITTYCSRNCQKADWKTHRKLYGKQNPPPRVSGPSQTTAPPPPQRSGAPPTSSALDVPVSDPFTRLDNGTWLHDRPEKDVFRLLIFIPPMDIISRVGHRRLIPQTNESGFSGLGMLARRAWPYLKGTP